MDDLKGGDQMIATMAAVILAAEVNRKGITLVGEDAVAHAIRIARAAVRATVGSKS
jgi:NaMN:DMB phosphoribosyltransferase